MHILKLGVRSFEGLESLDLEPGMLNTVQGVNGSGKTSLLDAIRVLFTNKKQRSLLVHDEHDRGTILFSLSDGTTGERVVTPHGRTAGPVTMFQDGVKMKSAQAFHLHAVLEH